MVLKLGIYTNLEDISMQGSLGDPFASTAEIGKVYFDRMVECGIKFVEKMQASDMHIKNVKLRNGVLNLWNPEGSRCKKYEDTICFMKKSQHCGAKKGERCRECG